MRSNCVPRKKMERTVANFKPEFVFVNHVSLGHTIAICVHAVKLLSCYSNRAAAAVPSLDLKSVSILILVFPASRTVRNLCL